MSVFGVGLAALAQPSNEYWAQRAAWPWNQERYRAGHPIALKTATGSR